MPRSPFCFFLRYVLLHGKAPLLILAPLGIFSCVLLHDYSPCTPGVTDGLFANGSFARRRVSHPYVAVRKFSHEALVKKRAMLRHAMRTEGQGQQIPSRHAHPVRARAWVKSITRKSWRALGMVDTSWKELECWSYGILEWWYGAWARSTPALHFSITPFF